jgi:hypothetical protein
VRNPGGKKTPQESICPSSDVVRSLARITQLISDARRSQGALKKLVRHRFQYSDGLLLDGQVLARDGHTCALTGHSFDLVADISVDPQCAHILPFSLWKKVRSCTM